MDSLVSPVELGHEGPRWSYTKDHKGHKIIKKEKTVDNHRMEVTAIQISKGHEA